MKKAKREIIFEMPETYGKYRVVCRYGHDYHVDYAWWGHLQRQVLKKPLLWGKVKEIWVEVDKCWWSKEFDSMENLKESAAKFYDENIELPIRLREKAMLL